MALLPASPSRRARRVAVAVFAAIAAPWLGASALGWIHLSTPVDVALNLWPVPDSVAASAARREPGEVVVLIHGLSRGPWSLWRLERALRAQGYEVWNEGYDSRALTAEAAARDLAQRIGERVRAGAAPRRLHAVAHSLGGLLLRRIAAEAQGFRIDRGVCLGTPQRGAAMAEALHGALLYRAFLGNAAALDLRPGSAFVCALPARPACELASIVGARGDEWGWSRIVPGDDDGRVGLRETEIEGERARLVLPIGHTALSTDARVLAAVSRYLATGSF